MEFILNVLEWEWVATIIGGALAGWFAQYRQSKPGRIFSQIIIKGVEAMEEQDRKKATAKIKETMRKQLGTNSKHDKNEKEMRDFVEDVKKRDWLTKKK